MEKSVYRSLLGERSTPFYVFDTQGFIENYQALQAAMQQVYPNYRVAYSYKTNYTPYICNLVKSLGGYAEVVSDMEYRLAKKLGYENSRIVYNGPAKGSCMEEHLRNGGISNVDNPAEAARVAQLAAACPECTIKIGLRINMDLGFVSRFGMSVGSPELTEAINLLHRHENVKIVGLHCHISRNRWLPAWEKRAQIMVDAAGRYVDGTPEYISLGSGMFADMDEVLRAQFGQVPTYEEYAQAAMKPFIRRYPQAQPIVFTEPGTTVVARYLSFVTRVLDIKTVHSRTIATLDGSYENLGEICTMKKLPLCHVTAGAGQEYESVDLMGYTCLEQDLMLEGYSGPLCPGDVLAFQNVGGYSIVSKPQFIRPNCAMVAVEPDGTVREIMREETFEDVFSKFVFPEEGQK